MHEFNDPASADSASSPGAALHAAGFAEADDLALGWECANPALQIESWHQEAGAVSEPR
ncbi:hypothetical protein [Ramlibacter sp.]|uniref:hypothetical protein n=1 Tax=Ramlibacter sp. TaxID=1917967 RepID=UPI0017F670D5|nr:hypothetical protein [Ramlibacter sp.]MBA2673018.1 hypothetical protein [Ramlibacter sp.]